MSLGQLCKRRQQSSSAPIWVRQECIAFWVCWDRNQTVINKRYTYISKWNVWVSEEQSERCGLRHSASFPLKQTSCLLSVCACLRVMGVFIQIWTELLTVAQMVPKAPIEMNILHTLLWFRPQCLNWSAIHLLTNTESFNPNLERIGFTCLQYPILVYRCQDLLLPRYYTLFCWVTDGIISCNLVKMNIINLVNKWLMVK